MIDLKTLTSYLNDYLEIDSIEDGIVNGLQVEGNNKINRIGFAVDACLETFEKAKQAGCDMLITHHGLGYKGLKTVTGIDYKRIRFLIVNNMALYTAHLPLDKHPTVGNNIQLANQLKLKNIQRFADIGFKGELEFHESVEQFSKRVKDLLNSNLTVLPFGKPDIKKVAIITGAGGSFLKQAIEDDVDVLLVGEASHSSYHDAKEGQMNLVLAGHYATEIAGVKALATVIKEKFDVEVGFIDTPVTF